MFIFAGFLQEKLRIIYIKRVLTLHFFVLSRVKSSMSGSSATLCPREPSPSRSMGEKAWWPYASSTESWRTTRAQFNSMPTILVSTTLFLKNRTVSRFRVHFKHGSILKNISLSVRIFGSGFKPYFKLYLITGWDPDSNRYPP